jgi:hypothetical protein
MRPRKHTWDMPIGSSFFAPNRSSSSIQNDARKHHKPRKYRCTKVVVKGVIGVKVTRIE